MKPQGEKPKPEHLPCVNCRARLKPRYATRWRQQEVPSLGGAGMESVEEYTGEILGYGVAGFFCTNECAIRFGIRAAKVGVKLNVDLVRASVTQRRRKPRP